MCLKSFSAASTLKKTRKRKEETSSKLKAHLKLQEEANQAKKLKEEKITDEENEDKKPKEIIITALTIIRRY